MRRPDSPRLADRLGPALLLCAAACSATEEPVSDTSAPEPAPTSPASVEPEPAPTLSALDRDEWHVATADDGSTHVAWRPVGGRVPRNEPFSMEVLLFRGDEPDGGAGLLLRGWMPDHGHGQVQKPVVSEVGGGRYLVEGVLLHMRGTWQLIFEITEDAARATAESVVEL